MIGFKAEFAYDPGMAVSWQVLTSFAEIYPSQWNHLAQTHAPDFPFVRHDFLMSLEISGSLGDRTGWHPLIVVGFENDKLAACCPLFLKTNSYGEYIFDFAWAEASIRHGIPYYPKLVGGIPFTPATGPKLLAPIEKASELISFTTDWALQHSHSLHFLFTSELDSHLLQNQGFLVRESFQYHWHNRRYRDFNDFLDALRAKRRKEIRRERFHDFEIHHLTGSELTSQHAELMYEFYLSTIDKKGSHDYLTREFFLHVFSRMPQQILLVLAYDKGQAVAGALNFMQGQNLYGRYWGAREDYKNLHFELCYYQTIEYAIAKQIAKFEAGAQGEHKIARGFSPQITYSAHNMLRSPLRKAIEDFVEQEKRETAQLLEHLNKHSPYR